jgi:hypothetical protein
MTMNLSDVRDAYQEYLKNRRDETRTLCPSAEKILEFSRSGLTKKERAAIATHVAQCYDCSRELRNLLEIIREESRFIQAMNEVLVFEPQEEDQKAGFLVKTLSWRFLSWALLIVLGAAVATFSVLRLTSRSDLRRGGASQVESVSPAGKAYAAGELKFVWKDFGRTKYYSVEVFDASLAPIWRSQAVLGNEMLPPEALLEKLASGQSYFWMVTAVLENGEEVKSRLKEFRIRPQ